VFFRRTDRVFDSVSAGHGVKFAAALAAMCKYVEAIVSGYKKKAALGVDQLDAALLSLRLRLCIHRVILLWREAIAMFGERP
jgi:hypothetical protein